MLGVLSYKLCNHITHPAFLVGKICKDPFFKLYQTSEHDHSIPQALTLRQHKLKNKHKKLDDCLVLKTPKDEPEDCEEKL